MYQLAIMQTHVQHTLIILQHEPDNLKHEIPQITQNIINTKLQYWLPL